MEYRAFSGNYATEAVQKYIAEKSLRLHPAQEKLRQKTLEHHMDFLPGPAVSLQLLQSLVKLINAKKTLDIGVFTGYSALTIALALPECGRVVACDITDKFISVGKPFWREAGVQDKIDLIISPATDTLQELIDKGESGTYDFAFIDADKESYKNYYELCIKLVRSGGIIAIDNVLWNGFVVDEKRQDSQTVGIRSANDHICSDQRVNISMLSVGDGLTICFKK